MGDLRNKLRKLTRIFFTGAYYEYDFGTEIAVTISLDTLAVAYAH